MDDGPSARRRRKIYLLAQLMTLTRDERMDLAQMVLRRDITSWGDLDDDQVARMLDTLEGYLLISSLLATRAPASDTED